MGALVPCESDVVGPTSCSESGAAAICEGSALRIAQKLGVEIDVGRRFRTGRPNSKCPTPTRVAWLLSVRCAQSVLSYDARWAVTRSVCVFSAQCSVFSLQCSDRWAHRRRRSPECSKCPLECSARSGRQAVADVARGDHCDARVLLRRTTGSPRSAWFECGQSHFMNYAAAGVCLSTWMFGTALSGTRVCVFCSRDMRTLAMKRCATHKKALLTQKRDSKATSFILS